MGRAMRLTEARIRSLTSQGREYKEYFHEPTPSAGIRIYRGGRKVFFLYYRSPTVMSRGKADEALLRRVWFGCHESGKPAWRKDPDRTKRKSRLPCISLKEFEIEYRKFVGKLAEGIDPQGGPEPETKAEAQPEMQLEASPWLRDLWPDGYGEGTVSHLLAQYFDAARTGTIHQKPLKPRTLNGYTTAARIYILKRLRDWPATSITQDQVSDLFTEIAKTAPQMVRSPAPAPPTRRRDNATGARRSGRGGGEPAGVPRGRWRPGRPPKVSWCGPAGLGGGALRRAVFS
jgi:hypothetical protein